ncbi:unnamed protein product [Plutella xylostella]|uniref:(diamondback moth) hypothetical protein n=1 Tax=Plutella xylostella TaxID=51655 RepID=A0A8S4DIE2_PLUXY|nr:unnamed protein product [Plutella xylostella]
MEFDLKSACSLIPVMDGEEATSKKMIDAVEMYAGMLNETDLTISQSDDNPEAYGVLKPLNEKTAIKRFSDGLRSSRLSTIIAARNYSSLSEAIQAAKDEETMSTSSSEVLQFSATYNRDFSENNEFVIQTDASGTAIGAVLCNKDLRPIAYASRPLNKAERNYPTIQKELVAIVWAVKYFRPKRALVHHPDRHAGAPDSERREQERRFKEVGEAYGILSDPKKRARYDHGQDIDDDGAGMADIDPNVVFQSFFNRGPQNFNFGAGGGGGFPGSAFNFQFG